MTTTVPETQLHVTTRARLPARLDDPGIDAPDPSIASLVRRAGTTASVVLVGGEPTLRADLPALLGALPAPTLCTDGLALSAPGTLRELRAAGMRRLRVVLHSARPEAHDWLVGQPGAARRAMRVLLASSELGLPTEIEATLTRPTASHVAELIVLAEGLGVRVVHLVRLAHRGTARREAIMLAPRWGLLEDPLDEAASAAIRGRIALSLHGFPRCVAPKLGDATQPSRVHAFADEPAWAAVAAAYDTERGPRCASCPGEGVCEGPAAEYLARFGSGEVVSERARPERPPVELAPIGAPESVAPRAGRAPVTRLRDIRAIVRRGGVEGDPLIDQPGVLPPVLRVSFAPTRTSTRVLRARLIRAAQEGASVLCIAGGFDHPAAADLLREAARLPGAAVELAGTLTPLYGLSDAQIFELEGIARARAVLTSPDEIDAALAFLARLQALAAIESGAIVLLRSIADAEAWRDAFARLPGEASVRVVGVAPAAIAVFARALPPSAYRAALERPVDEAPPTFVDDVVRNAPPDDDELLGR